MKIGLSWKWWVLLAFTGCATSPVHWPQSLLDAREASEAVRKIQDETGVVPSFLEAMAALQKAEKSFVQDEAAAVWEGKTWRAKLLFQIAEAEALTLITRRAITALERSHAVNREAEIQQHENKVENLLTEAKGMVSEPLKNQVLITASVYPWNEWAKAAGQFPGVTVQLNSDHLVLVLWAEELFENESSQWRDKTIEARLQPLAAWLGKLPGLHFRIEGHTDDQGSSLQNNVLSQARAENLSDLFHRQGVPLDRLEPIGLGAAKLLAPKQTPEGRQKNHRLEIFIGPK